MSNNRKLTPKQIEALKPLEEQAATNRKLKDRLQKRLVFEHAMGFDENQVVRGRIDELEAEYKELSVQIADIYAAEAEMVKHMNNVLREVKEVERLKALWGFVTD